MKIQKGLKSDNVEKNMRNIRTFMHLQTIERNIIFIDIISINFEMQF